MGTLPFSEPTAGASSAQTTTGPADGGDAVADLTILLTKHIASGGTLAELLEIAPDTMEAAYAHAYRLYQNARFDDAMQVFSLLLTRDQFDGRYYIGFAACLQMNQRPEEALKYHGMASLLDLSDPLPVFYCAQCLLALKRTDEALSALDMVEKLALAQPAHHELASRAHALRQLLMQTDDLPATGTGAGHA